MKAIKSLEELEEVFRGAGDRAVLVDFHATWCGPCKMIAPRLEEFSKTYPNVIVLKVDVDEAEDVAAKYEISAMPTFIVFKRGAVVATLLGASPEKVEGLFSTYN